MTTALRARLFLLAVFVVVMSLPLLAKAEGMQGDIECSTKYCYPGKCTPSPKDPNCAPCPLYECTDITSGFPTVGKCVNSVPGKCKAVTAGGRGVDSGLSQLGQILGQLLGKLMQPQPSSPSSGTSPYPTTPGTGCTTGQYFQTSDVTLLSNPCAQYQPPANPVPIPSPTSTCTALSQLLGNCTTPSNNSFSASPTSGVTPLTVTFTGSVTGTIYSIDFGDGSPTFRDQCASCVNATVSTTHNYTVSGNYTATLTDKDGNQAGTASISVAAAGGRNVTQNPSTATTTRPNLGTPAILSPGATQGQKGDIVVGQGGATIYGTSQDLASNTGVAGFFGNGTFGGQSLTLGARLCQSRPWAAGVLGAILPTSFFDGICKWRGYQVGMPPAPSVQLQQGAPAKKTGTTTSATTTQTIPAKVQIWAVPATVPLATRTSIFWSTQGVTNCTETSPDGNFSQNTLSGGAATVPITGATTFTISCTDYSGNPITDYVTVNLSI